MDTTTQRASDARNKLASNLKTVIKDAEELLKHTGQSADEGYQSARTRFESTLQSAKSGLTTMEESVIAKTKDAMYSTDRYVQHHPWQAVGIGALTGLIIGLVAGRR